MLLCITRIWLNGVTELRSELAIELKQLLKHAFMIYSGVYGVVALGRCFGRSVKV